ncbi:MAG: hypothetical protein PHU85_04110 [Phycisphaerae bacterium]|nr:hypothetical protein [Phycisphaerae bacterium]
MNVAARINQERTANEIRAALLGLKCWNVACGGSAGTTFQLALGGKEPRKVPLRNPNVSEQYRRFEGQVGLMVWCSWRLEGVAGPLTSSEDESPGLVKGLARLTGKSIVRAALTDDWYLQLDFSGELRLSIFPDRVERGWTLGNWEVWTPDREYAVGADLACTVTRRPRRVATRAIGRLARGVRARPASNVI